MNSITSLDKLIFNNMNRSEHITKFTFNINKDENNNILTAKWILVDNKIENYKIDLSQNYYKDKEEVFLSNSIISLSDLNSEFNKSSKILSKNSSINNTIESIKYNSQNIFNHNNSDNNLSINEWEENNEKNNPINTNDNCIPNFLNSLEIKEFFESNCSICYMNFSCTNEYVIINKCYHIFHFECLEKWINISGFNKNECPYCRVKIK